ncbi:MAG TPA: NADH-ubiquinone oxidoreductase-F iron-sulfur binding region domain-containing protein [Acidobacteriota bacterium]|nr:NADH-ubiquinone oxidoreductase-F iron-sulfur binding region domain-containing protein [Acidobacteriota bacterium]
MQNQVVLKNCGRIDPRNINSFMKTGGFAALEKARRQMTPEAVIEEVTASGLLGRGGAGFSCGRKWELARKQPDAEKYVICNADEGEVGTFKDRYILEHDPFTLIEALAIAAFAIGASKTFIYIRAEYHFLLPLLERALEQAQKKGFLKDTEIELREGAGAYMCGEESGLINSIEGLRGEARYKPPFPVSRGLWGKPTVVNNVETLMNVPPIILNGSRWFQGMGTEKSRGTKVFSVSGDVEAPGVYELELGSELAELVTDLASARRVKMVQVGGATGRIIPASMLDIPLAYESVLGSGAVTVFDESRDVIDIMLRNMEFLADESCGKCTPCREGTEVMLEILGRLARGDGDPEDLPLLEELGQVMTSAALCGLGQAAPVPVLDTLNHFKKEYENRIGQSMLLRNLSGRRKPSPR